MLLLGRVQVDVRDAAVQLVLGKPGGGKSERTLNELESVSKVRAASVEFSDRIIGRKDICPNRRLFLSEKW